MDSELLLRTTQYIAKIDPENNDYYKVSTLAYAVENMPLSEIYINFIKSAMSAETLTKTKIDIPLLKMHHLIIMLDRDKANREKKRVVLQFYWRYKNGYLKTPKHIIEELIGTGFGTSLESSRTIGFGGVNTPGFVRTPTKRTRVGARPPTDTLNADNALDFVSNHIPDDCFSTPIQKK